MHPDRSWVVVFLLCTGAVACAGSKAGPGGSGGGGGGGGAGPGVGDAGMSAGGGAQMDAADDGAAAAAANAIPLLDKVSDRFPAADATSICADARLRLTFTVPVKVGVAGKVRVWRASTPDVPVDTIDVVGPFRDTIGGRSFALNRPIFIDGMQAVVYLHRAAMLQPNETYYVTVDAGVFVDTAGASLGAIQGPTTWRWTTRASNAVATPDNLVVSLDNTGDFCSVQSAVDFIPPMNTAPVTITIKNGVYREIVFISRKNNITIHGEDRKATVIAYANNGTLQGGGTMFRAMVEVEGSNDLVIENITLHNLTPQDGSQAEALRVEPGDRVILRNADFISLQDTLLLSGRVYVTNCTIEGNVDFVWGTGTAYFDKCEIKTVGRPGYGVQARNPANTNGYVFVDSKLTADPPGLAGHFLARIDGSYPGSHVAYINCEMGSHINPAGWLITAVNTSMIRFWEYKSVDPSGMPIDVSKRVAASRQLTDAEAAVMRDKAMVLSYPPPAWNPTP